MGLGARASAASTSAIQYNPAGLATGEVYHVESVAGYEPSSSRFSLGAAVVDSHSSPLAMGLSYRYLHGNGDYGHAGMDGRLALALKLGDAFAVGIAGRYVSYWREGKQAGDTRGPFVQSPNFDLAVRVNPVEGLYVAAIAQNLIDVGSALTPRLVGGSASYTLDNMLTLAFDGFADLSTFRYDDDSIRPEGLLGGAAELFYEGVPIRAGYYYDTGRDSHTLSAGVGYVRPEFSVELSYRQQIVGGDDNWLLLGFRYFIH